MKLFDIKYNTNLIDKMYVEIVDNGIKDEIEERFENNIIKIYRSSCPSIGKRYNLYIHNSYNLEKLGDNVTHLTLGDYYNESIVGANLKNVTHLTFGWAFNQSITPNVNGNSRFAIYFLLLSYQSFG